MGERHFVFGDESGTPDLRDDPEFPVFAVVMGLIEESAYQSTVVPMVEDLKQRHFGDRKAPLHERDIRRKTGLIARLDDDGWAALVSDLTSLLHEMPWQISAVAIDKRQPRRTLSARFDPYAFCVNVGLEQVRRHLAEVGVDARLGRIVFEGRGRREDGNVQREVSAFRRVVHRSLAVQPEIEFATKASAEVGIELADLIAYPIARHVIDRPQANLPFKIVADKLIDGGNGNEGKPSPIVVPR